jgi:RNA polymerase sigma factor (sigma-70 family)
MSGQATALTEFVAQNTEANSFSAATESQISFDEAFTLHHRAIYRTACALVRDAALAEDIVQEVFLKLHRKMETAPGEELLRAWLLRVAINAALNALRGQQRARTREEEFVKDEASRNSFASAPDDEYERRAEIEKAQRALERLGEPTRSCLLLKEQGLSYREIAAALSIKETNVGSLIARGRKEFQRIYGKIGARQ